MRVREKWCRTFWKARPGASLGLGGSAHGLIQVLGASSNGEQRERDGKQLAGTSYGGRRRRVHDGESHGVETASSFSFPVCCLASGAWGTARRRVRVMCMREAGSSVSVSSTRRKQAAAVRATHVRAEREAGPWLLVRDVCVLGRERTGLSGHTDGEAGRLHSAALKNRTPWLPSLSLRV